MTLGVGVAVWPLPLAVRSVWPFLSCENWTLKSVRSLTSWPRIRNMKKRFRELCPLHHGQHSNTIRLQFRIELIPFQRIGNPVNTPSLFIRQKSTKLCPIDLFNRFFQVNGEMTSCWIHSPEWSLRHQCYDLADNTLLIPLPIFLISI